MANITVDKNCCKGCYICVSACPKDIFATSKKRSKYGTNMPAAEHMEDCVFCRMCERMCPDGAINVKKVD